MPSLLKRKAPPAQSPAQSSTTDIDNASNSQDVEATIRDFDENLTADEKSLRDATTKASQLLEAVQEDEQKHGEKSKPRQVAKFIRPFVASIEHYGKALDVMSNSINFICPVWGSARVLLKVAAEFGDYFENLAKMFEQIGQQLDVFGRYRNLYPDNQKLKELMLSIFHTIFDFLIKAIAVFKRGKSRSKGISALTTSVGLAVAIKTTWKPFQNQFGDIITRISRSVAAIETEVNIAEKEKADEERRKQDDERALQQAERELERQERAARVMDRFKRGAQLAKIESAATAWTSYIDERASEKLNSWLAPVNVAANHTAATKVRHDSSGTWFMDGDVFKKWLKEDNSFLWLHAIPGAGKTVLASTIINYLQQHEQSAQAGVAYFYCDYRETQKQQPLRVLTTILSMLAIKNRKIFLEMQSYFQTQISQNPAYVPGFDEIRDNFSSFVRHHCEQILIVVDALDECNERDELASALKMISQNCSSVKILVTSRYENDIASVLGSSTQTSIQEQDVAIDIEKYIQAELDTRIVTGKLTLFKKDLKDTIAQTLVRGAKGMFQWVKCQIDHLCKQRSDKKIRQALNNLPKNLHDTYIRILEHIEQQNEDDIESVQRVLRWLVKSTRNMTLRELAECISIEPDGDETDMDFEAVITRPNAILELCGSLVVVSVDKYVSIAHYSAKEFLVSTDLKNRMPQFWVGGTEVEAELATVCLKYLCYDDFSSGALESDGEVVALLEKYEALKYVSRSWAIHAYRSRDHGLQPKPVIDLTMRLFDSREEEGSQSFRLWEQIYYFKNGSARNLISRSAFNPLSFASCFGLTEAVERLLGDGIPSDCAENIKLAAAEGHADVVQAFLCVVPSCSRPNMQAAFHAAAARGHIDVVKLLLEEGVSINFRSERDGKDLSAIHAAALEGRPEVVKLLLERGADAKFPCKRWGTPLACAAEKGHFTTVKVLLDHGANPNGQGGWNRYPLISAVLGKNLDIVDLLIERGANINALGGRQGCALGTAASLGMPDLVTKLVERGADVNDGDDKGSDALYAACMAGHLDIVNLLLDLGADVNAKGGKHRNALNAASAQGNVGIVKRLIEAGADIAFFDEHIGNAVQIAAYHGHEEVVQVLSEAGVDINAPASQRGSALECAAMGGCADVVSLLFDLGVTTDNTQEVSNALVLAAMNGHTSTVALLIDTGVDINDSSRIPRLEDRTPLEAAAYGGHLEVVELLIQHNAEINHVDEESTYGTPLIAAMGSKNPSSDVIHALFANGVDPNITVGSTKYATYGYALPAAVHQTHIELVKLLIGRGADVNLFHANYLPPLQIASSFEDTTIFDYLLSCGADANLVIENSNISGYKAGVDQGTITPLQHAAYNGMEQNVRKLLELGADLSVKDDYASYKSALQAAAHCGHTSIVQILLDAGADVNEIGGWHSTSLIAAAEEGHLETAEVLLKAGADVNYTPPKGDAHPQTALIAAAENNCDEVLRLLLDNGADPNKAAMDGWSHAVHAAAYLNHIESLEVLIDKGANVNAIGSGKYPVALHGASDECHLDAAELLLENGADPNLVGGYFGTALSAAYSKGWVDMIRLLYKYGANASLQIGGCFDSAMGSALRGSCAILTRNLVWNHSYNIDLPYGKFGNALQDLVVQDRDDVELMLRVFIHAGADVNQFGGRYGSALTAAMWMGRQEAATILLDNGANINAQGNARYPNALYGVVDSEDRENAQKLFDWLLSRGCQILPNANNHGTLIQRAAFHRHTGIVKRLVRLGIDPDADATSKYGSTLQAAATTGQSSLLRYLVKKGSDVNRKGGRLGNPLIAAVASPLCSFDDIEFLLKKGADPNQRGGKHGYALQAATAAQKGDVILLLLRYGANLDAVGGVHGTALQAAVLCQTWFPFEILLERGADLSIEAGLYRTPLQAALLVYGDNEEYSRYIFGAGAPIIPINRQKLGHLSSEKIDAAEELMERIQYPPEPDEVDGEEQEEGQAWEDVSDGDENDEGEQDSDDQEDESGSEEATEDEDEKEQTRPLELNVTSIPGFDLPYIPTSMPRSEDGTDLSDEETVVASVENLSDKALELFSVFNADELVEAVAEDR